MDFSEIKPDDCMHTVSMDVTSELRDAVRSLYVGMYEKNEDLQARCPT